MKKYKLTDAELEELKEICKIVPYLVVDGMEPVSFGQRAMALWSRVAERVNCKLDSIEPDTTTEDLHDFLATPNE